MVALLLDRGANIDVKANVRAECYILWVWAIVTMPWLCVLLWWDVSDIDMRLCCSLPKCILQNGKTALHFASRHNKTGVVSLLLDRGVNIDAITKVRVWSNNA